ncbi:anhydro-N-acetylmuramic acid kinase [uncultured Cohaesibacter sp.]|uniref:anhydro-N-acetylmuramic acid kinase n=1 Tax=uncultured Cohaesibacter sp. TaxID=1002546 RepID=UPI002931193E|nr:anhydro-N-acetylmuramic acid kinase [uncultured Cohaesibacter sp.]
MAKNEQETVLAVGLMSGTSCDGVDAALIETDGKGFVRPLAFVFRPYGAEEQALIKRGFEDGRSMTDRNARPGSLAQAEAMITGAHIEAVNALLALEEVGGRKPDLIGFHGQTVWHDPGKGVTVQIGDGQALANACGCPVVYDFRAADVAAGGQGAPLVPIYHKALTASSAIPLNYPLAVVNIGGVANITWIDADGGLTAFDSGPGNALVNDWIHQKTGEAMDKDGVFAASGQVDFLALLGLMGNGYFRQAAPKSLDRNAFDLAPVQQLSLEDGAATLTAFTVETICLGLEHMENASGAAAQMVVVCGGGCNNPFMMAQLQDALEMPVMMSSMLGWNSDALEAEAFAYLAVRAQKDLPITFPNTTGVGKDMSGGLLVRPKP